MEKKAIIRRYAFFNMENITKIVFFNNCKNAPYNAIDFSDVGNKSVVGWYKWGDSETLYVAPTIGDKIYANKDSSYMFCGCKNLRTIKGLEYLDTSNVSTMEFMFACEELRNLNLSKFDTHNVIDMSCMFYGCKKIRSLNLSSFDTPKIRYMQYMFYECYALKDLNLRNFSMQHVKNTSYMFYRCRKLEIITFPENMDYRLKLIKAIEACKRM